MSKLKNVYASATRFFITLFLLIILAMPQIALAFIQITEIMYDLPGADSGREWIEVYNSSDEDVDLSKYKFLENDVNHRISIYDPDKTGLTNILKAGEYAVIADSPDKFLVDYPNYSRILFDSAFSLRDSGEELFIIDPNGEIVYSVYYLPEWGAKGTGNSLQLNGDIWIPAEPTPGATNKTVAANENGSDGDNSAGDTNGDTNGEDGGETNNNSTGNNTPNNTTSPIKTINTEQSVHYGQNPLSNFTKAADLKTGSGRVRFGIIHSPIKFEAISNYPDLIKHLSEEDLANTRNIRHQWSFGDTVSATGSSPVHTYLASGEYNVVLNTYFNGEHAINRNKILIREPKVDIMLISRGNHVDIMLENHSDFEVNFGHFYLKSHINQDFNDQNTASNRPISRTTYYFPQDTILDSKQTLIIPSYLTNFEFNPNFQVFLHYPNGKIAAEASINLLNSQELYFKISPFIEPTKLNLLYETLQNFSAGQNR